MKKKIYGALEKKERLKKGQISMNVWKTGKSLPAFSRLLGVGFVSLSTHL